MLVARELVASGCSVTLLDRSKFGQEASWAGGGIISPLYPWRYADAVTVLARWAQSFYPSLQANLLAETGIDVELVASGLLMLDADDAETAKRWAIANETPMEDLLAAELRIREPHLGPDFKHGLWMPRIANIRNPRLLKALVIGLLEQSRVSLNSHCEVQGFRVANAHIESVRAIVNGETREFGADRFIVCAGAWSRALLRESDPGVEVAPVKGQMLLFRLQQPLTRSILLTAGRYVIPRQDGHLLVGSTLEHCGFDKQATAQAREVLLKSARELLPALKENEPIAQWSGLRPGTQHGIPYIGRSRLWENLYVNTGQYRNGLVLAPASARLLVDILLERTPIVDPRPYALPA